MTDAEELRDILKMYGARWQGSERATVRRIADRLEKIDAPKPQANIYPSPPPGWPFVKDDAP